MSKLSNAMVFGALLGVSLSGVAFGEQAAVLVDAGGTGSGSGSTTTASGKGAGGVALTTDAVKVDAGGAGSATAIYRDTISVSGSGGAIVTTDRGTHGGHGGKSLTLDAKATKTDGMAAKAQVNKPQSTAAQSVSQ